VRNSGFCRHQLLEALENRRLFSNVPILFTAPPPMIPPTPFQIPPPPLNATAAPQVDVRINKPYEGTITLGGEALSSTLRITELSQTLVMTVKFSMVNSKGQHKTAIATTELVDNKFTLVLKSLEVTLKLRFSTNGKAIIGTSVDERTSISGPVSLRLV
jgi:hypothetical protein